MILIDTRIWIWWYGKNHLPDAYRAGIEDSRIDGVGVTQSHAGRSPSWSRRGSWCCLNPLSTGSQVR